jgi:methenyltetrahydromethanopterin cyclohydrolase
MTDKNHLSVGKLSALLVKQLLADAETLRLAVHTLDNGATLIDAGIAAPGGLEAGRRIAEICLGGLGRVRMQASGNKNWPFSLTVSTAQPVIACLGSQYAGWRLTAGEGRDGYFALGSGPGRALAAKETLYQDLGYRDADVGSACLVLESDKLPPPEIALKVAHDTGLPPSAITLIVTPTASLAGGVQIVARVLEVAMHKIHALEFPLADVVDGLGTAPLCPPGGDFITAMGRTNDAILYGGQVHLYVKGSNEAAKDLATRLPSGNSRDYGRPFAEVFKAYKGDFYQIDAMLFSPAAVVVTALDSGQTFHGGSIDNALVERSFGG